jgi:hypothetical protein
MFFVLDSVLCCITLIDLLNHPSIPGMNLTWSRCMILLKCCQILFAFFLQYWGLISGPPP